MMLRILPKKKATYLVFLGPALKKNDITTSLEPINFYQQNRIFTA